MRELYAGCDLHGNNLVGIIDGEGKRVFKKKLSNDLPLIRDTLKAFQRELVGIAVESTYNWYRLVDTLMERGIQDPFGESVSYSAVFGIEAWG